MSQLNSCSHCGADCGKSPIEWNDHIFCCNGCLQVYQLLNDNKLTGYYQLQQSPGIKLNQPVHDDKYAYLDREDIKDKIFEFREGDTAKLSLYIPTIHCASCIWLLEHLHKLHEGVLQASVNFMSKMYTVTIDQSRLTLRELVELLVSIHYVPDISPQSLEQGGSQKKSEDKALLYKIGVAGFVFGNVMLYSLPEYFSNQPIEGSLDRFLSYVAFILTVPVVFYSGNHYILSAYKNIRKGIVNIDLPIAIGILTLFFVTAVDIIGNRGPGYSDSLSGFLFFLLIGRWYQGKTYQSLSFDRNYKSYFPVAVTKLINGGQQSTLLQEIQVDDTLLIRSNELVPCDSVLEEGVALIDYSFVTGESAPIKKNPNEFIYAGGLQTAGAIKVRVKKEVEQSHLTQLWNQSNKTTGPTNNLISIVDKLSLWFTLIILAIAIASCAYWLILGEIATAILVLTSVLIVACPCALALSVPFTFGNAMRQLGNAGMYIKNINIIEKLTKINTLVFDKTGTLTKPDESDIHFYGSALNKTEEQMVLSLTAQSVHPLSYALARFYKEHRELRVEGFVEMANRGIYGKINGIEIKLGSKEFITGQNTKPDTGRSTVFLQIANQFRGYFAISNQYRKGYDSTLTKLGSKFNIHLLSGDNDTERNHLEQFFPEQQIHFNQKPKDKMDYVLELKRNGKNVLMTGDGLNDAGAFLESDVALSIADDIYHFSPAGDAIVKASKFHQLANFIKYAQQSLTIVKLNFIISLFYNIIGLAFAITGNLSPVIAAILMPISSVTVVAFATMATRLLAKRILSDKGTS